MGDRWTYGAARLFIARFWGPADDDRPLVIVLTVAHLNHEPEDCRPENLAAMCQRHHLAYDAQHHKQTAYSTRKAAARTDDLFAEVQACRPEDRALLQSAAGIELLQRAAEALIHEA